MTGAELALLAIGAVVIVLALFFSWGNRVDRLNRAVEAARASLDIQLAARAGAALDLARSGLLDPAACLVLADVARACLDLAAEAPPAGGSAMALGEDAAALHSELSGAISMAVEPAADADLLPPEVLADLASAWYRAVVARRFYNAAVRKALRLRSRRGVRVFRLAGRAPMPEYFEIDDREPVGLTPR